MISNIFNSKVQNKLKDELGFMPSSSYGIFRDNSAFRNQIVKNPFFASLNGISPADVDKFNDNLKTGVALSIPPQGASREGRTLTSFKQAGNVFGSDTAKLSSTNSITSVELNFNNNLAPTVIGHTEEKILGGNTVSRSELNRSLEPSNNSFDLSGLTGNISSDSREVAPLSVNPEEIIPGFATMQKDANGNIKLFQDNGLSATNSNIRTGGKLYGNGLLEALKTTELGKIITLISE